jgi:hypothetical protein
MSSNSRPDTMACHLYTVLFCSMLCLLQLAAASIPDPPIPRPDHTDHARLARWLAHYNTWGTLSTQGAHPVPKLCCGTHQHTAIVPSNPCRCARMYLSGLSYIMVQVWGDAGEVPSLLPCFLVCFRQVPMARHQQGLFPLLMGP